MYKASIIILFYCCYLSRIIKAKENRKHLVPIIECIILCGRQELALRGHRGETGKILVDKNGCYLLIFTK